MPKKMCSGKSLSHWDNRRVDVQHRQETPITLSPCRFDEARLFRGEEIFAFERLDDRIHVALDFFVDIGGIDRLHSAAPDELVFCQVVQARLGDIDVTLVNGGRLNPFPP
jgi:hypothetical protein